MFVNCTIALGGTTWLGGGSIGIRAGHPGGGGLLYNCFSPDLSSVYIQSKLELEMINENSFILAYLF